jgi:hypothetical protein
MTDSGVLPDGGDGQTAADGLANESGTDGGLDAFMPGMDVVSPGMDTTPGMDVVSPGMDVRTDGVSPGMDTMPGTDVPTMADTVTGCTTPLSVTVTAPAAAAMLYTCSPTGAAVYDDFQITVSGGSVATAVMNWRNPDALLVAPMFTSPGAAPTQITFDGTHYVGHRQVSGNMIPGAPVPLASAGGRNSIGGTWHFEVSVTDTCGRMASATQTFTFLDARTCP